ncbi:sulfurtransferase TusA family protein [Desulfosarcina sp.]|uniref:sulfurtransferase TusA family protein n=1 Tax=Desulfosarcina sp. TaxID=2027861 RepID=UPI00397055B5
MLTFDLRETLIPFSLLQVANAFRQMTPGEEMEICAGVTRIDAAILKDVLLILPQTDYDLLSIENRLGEDPFMRLILRKKQSPKTHQQQGDSSCQQSI